MAAFKVGIIVAAEPEAGEILSDREYRWECRGGVFRSKLGACLVVTGIGKANASFGLGRIFDLSEEFLGLGTSAALDGEPLSTFYLCEEFVEHDMDATGLGCALGVTPFSGMHGAVIKSSSQVRASLADITERMGFPLRYGRAISGDQVLTNPEIARKKREYFAAQVADMETASLAKICVQRAKGFAALRYVSDHADEETIGCWQEHAKMASKKFNEILKELLKRI